MLINGDVPADKNRWRSAKLGGHRLPWEVTREERGGELMFRYVRRRIRGRASGSRRPP